MKHKHKYILEFSRTLMGLGDFQLTWICKCGDYKDWEEYNMTKKDYKKAVKLLLEFKK